MFPFPLSFARRVCRGLLCAAQALASALLLYGLFFLRPLLPFAQSPADGPEQDASAQGGSPGTVLVLAHPALHNAASWFFHRSALRKAGYRQLVFFEYSCRERSLEQAGNHLATLIEHTATDHAKVILVGASLGGLVARAALAQLARPERLAGLITLACPHKGTRLAALVPRRIFPLLASIRYGGSALGTLETREKERPTPWLPKIAVFSPLDELVLPEEALRPPAAQGWQERRTGPLSHMSIMLYPEALLAALRELKPTAPPARGG